MSFVNNLKFKGVSTNLGQVVYGSGIMARDNKLYITTDIQGQEWNIFSGSLSISTGMIDADGLIIFEGDVLEFTESSWAFSSKKVCRVKVVYSQARFWCTGDKEMYLAELLSKHKCYVIKNEIDEHYKIIFKQSRDLAEFDSKRISKSETVSSEYHDSSSDLLNPLNPLSPISPISIWNSSDDYPSGCPSSRHDSSYDSSPTHDTSSSYDSGSFDSSSSCDD